MKWYLLITLWVMWIGVIKIIHEYTDSFLLYMLIIFPFTYACVTLSRYIKFVNNLNNLNNGNTNNKSNI